MYKIIVKGEAKTNYQNLSELDGIDCQDEFSEYFDKREHKSLIDKGVRNGYMRFDFDHKQDKLYTITEFQSDEKLDKNELELLGDFCQGQWSDGIGECFEQEPCFYDNDGKEVYIYPWFYKQEIEVYQEEII